MSEKKKPKEGFPPQHQDRQPGIESKMKPRPAFEPHEPPDGGKLAGKRAIVTGGDSGIGRAVAVLFAREGADVAIVYLDEHEDAEATRTRVEAEGRRCLLIPGDVADPAFCDEAVERTVKELGGIEILVNNSAVQYVCEGDFEDIPRERIERTFRVNILGMIWMTQAALPHLEEGAAIVNTTSVTAYHGSGHLVDYASTKGAIVGFTRSLALMLVERGIRVNAVAPGPVWTPLIVASFPADQVAEFGQDTPMGRAGQPAEIAPSYLFLACDDAAYMTGQVLHPNGGEIVNG